MYNNIVLKPSWLGKIDYSKRYCNNSILNNRLTINKIMTNNNNHIDIEDDNATIKEYDVENIDIDKISNDKKTINTINLKNFPYYDERAEYIKNNAVFIKPQIQNFYAKEFELLNNFKTPHKQSAKDEICYDDEDFSMFNIQRKKQKKKKSIISKIFDDIKDLKDLKDLKNNNDLDNFNTNFINENNINNNNNNNNNSVIQSESDVNSDDDSYFQNTSNKKHNKKNK
jgi:hypothetical protein